MKRPEEEQEIHSKIRAKAKSQKSFTLRDLYYDYMGDHYISDWEECLANLVKREQLSLDGHTYRKEDDNGV